MLRTLKLLVLAVFALVIITSAATPSHESTGEFLDSTAITAAVKANLVDKLGTPGFAINVKTYKDEVRLSGFIDNADLKRQAGDVASENTHVRHVRNNLVVKMLRRY